jgi:hypothetical protein
MVVVALGCENRSWRVGVDVATDGTTTGRAAAAAAGRSTACGKYLKANEKSTTIDRQIIQIAVRQLQEYEQTKANVTTAAEKQKQSDAKIIHDMELFEGGLGALPPGAQGIVGGGRRQHSTNLKTNQPAAYFYAHHDTGVNEVAKEAQPQKAKAKAKVKSPTAPPNTSDKNAGISIGLGIHAGKSISIKPSLFLVTNNGPLLL